MGDVLIIFSIVVFFLIGVCFLVVVRNFGVGSSGGGVGDLGGCYNICRFI